MYPRNQVTRYKGCPLNFADKFNGPNSANIVVFIEILIASCRADSGNLVTRDSAHMDHD